MGCPYLPPTDDAAPWTPAHLAVAGVLSTVCPGFSTTTPEVGEVVDAYPHWEHGTLRDHVGGHPSPALLAGLVALKGGMRERDDAAIAERNKKGGG